MLLKILTVYLQGHKWSGWQRTHITSGDPRPAAPFYHLNTEHLVKFNDYTQLKHEAHHVNGTINPEGNLIGVSYMKWRSRNRSFVLVISKEHACQDMSLSPLDQMETEGRLMKPAGFSVSTYSDDARWICFPRDHEHA
jgi:hypothetical protein